MDSKSDPSKILYEFKLRVSVATKDWIDALAVTLGCSSFKELFNVALSLLSFAIDELAKGKKLGLMDEATGVFTPVKLPFVNFKKPLKPKTDEPPESGEGGHTKRF